MGLLIVEEVRPDDVEIITEEKNGKKNYYIHGKYMQAECVNGNGRRYPLSTMKNEVDRYREKYIKENRAFGELSHPDTPRINLERVSHIITSLEQAGNDFVGKARVLDTPTGLIAQKIMEGGGRLGVSSRAVGSIKEERGVNVVQPDFRLSTAADIVFDPSAPDAFVQGIMESKSWIWDAGLWKEQELTKAKKIIAEAKTRDLEEILLAQFTKLMKQI